MQLKSRLIFGVPIIAFLTSVITTYTILNFFNPLEKEVAEISEFEIAEQESVIEEQPAIGAGAGYIINQNCPKPIIVMVPIKQILVIKETQVSSNSLYASTIESLTEEDRELICRITWREAGNQKEKGQRAVMEVILNRIESDTFPDTAYGVLSQTGQFSTWAGRNEVTTEQIEQMQNILNIIYQEENTILTKEYVYFDKIMHDYGHNYVRIKGHWFGTEKEHIETIPDDVDEIAANRGE